MALQIVHKRSEVKGNIYVERNFLSYFFVLSFLFKGLGDSPNIRLNNMMNEKDLFLWTRTYTTNDIFNPMGSCKTCNLLAICLIENVHQSCWMLKYLVTYKLRSWISKALKNLRYLIIYSRCYKNLKNSQNTCGINCTRFTARSLLIRFLEKLD